MRANGPEPVLIQLKQAAQESEELESAFADLEAFEAREQLTVQKKWAGGKYIELLSFPDTFTEAQALGVITRLKELSYIEKVVAVSAFNLEFNAADFEREFAAAEQIPDATKRGLDTGSA